MKYPSKLYVLIPGLYTIDECDYLGWVYWNTTRNAYSSRGLEGVMYSYNECIGYAVTEPSVR